MPCWRVLPSTSRASRRSRRRGADDTPIRWRTGLLSAVAARFGSVAFTVGDLRRGAAIDAELHAAVAGRGARRLGARLKHLHRHGGGAPYVVERVGHEAGGALWCITLPDTETL